MLNKLTVRNLAVVEQVEVEFASGLNVLTGETGAGKSVIMGALELVLGGRADASVVREGAKEAEVEAVFDGKVVRRTITAQGRSRAWIDDESVSVQELKEFGRELVDIHGPTANQKLVEEVFQREALDGFGAVDGAAYSACWSELSSLNAQFAELNASGGEDELDLLRFQVNELESAALSEDDATIAERHAAAAHAGEIVERANAITEGLGGDQSAAALLISLQPEFQGLAKHLPAAADWAAEAEELTVRIQELSRTVADAVSGLDLGEEDLEELDRRLTVVNKLKRKYLRDVGERVDGGEIERLMRILEEKKQRLGQLENRDVLLEELRGKIEAAMKRVRTAGAALSKKRAAAAEKLATCVTHELVDLGFLQAKFFVRLEPIEPESHGMDQIVFMFEPNPGEPARPLAQIASSGEIARVMLALKCVEKGERVKGGKGERVKGEKGERVKGREGERVTLVFDEIDANIGGETGSVVGAKLRAVSRMHQVIAITHLPQTAACGDRHLVVAKAVSQGRTRTSVSQVEGGARVAEIARMLGGEKANAGKSTGIVKRHAEELLRVSR